MMRIRASVSYGLAGIVLSLGLAGTARAAGEGCVRPLAPCPDKPNCVATNDPLPDRRYPPLMVNGDPQVAWTKIVDTLLAKERTAKVAEAPGYLHATFTSAVFEFVDDVEITYCKDGQELWIRSASRKGYWDMGANQSRVEDLVEAWRDQSLLK